MSNDKHYPTHPGAEHPPIMTCEIPLEEYESLKRENERLTIDYRNTELRADVADATVEKLKAENAELKAKVDELSFDKKLLDNHWESDKIRCEAASRDCIELSNENAKLVSKIESLKVGHRQGIANIKSYYKAKLESVQASMYCDVVDANMANRRLKRALYKACFNWAHFAVAFFAEYATKEKWRKMENKCLAKAKEYK